MLKDDFSFECSNLTSNEILDKIKLVGGLDISASKVDETCASVAIVIMDFISKKVVFKNKTLVKLTQPYVPGFLAFREVEHLNNIVSDLKVNNPEFIPDVLIIDGNGIYHTAGFGLACHLGVLCGLPTLGCGKTNFSVDGLTTDKVDEISQKELKKKHDYVYLKGNSGEIHGAAMKYSDNYNNYVIISQGNKIGLKTACLIVKEFLLFKVIEPVRIADKISREHIREYDKNFH